MEVNSFKDPLLAEEPMSVTMEPSTGQPNDTPPSSDGIKPEDIEIPVSPIQVNTEAMAGIKMNDISSNEVPAENKGDQSIMRVDEMWGSVREYLSIECNANGTADGTSKLIYLSIIDACLIVQGKPESGRPNHQRIEQSHRLYRKNVCWYSGENFPGTRTRTKTR
jgi:hypothetical protein